MLRALLAITGIAAVLAMTNQLCVFAQSPPVFDVASIKPSSPDTGTETRRYPGGRFTATGVTLKALIQRAYDVKDFQISGGPKWLGSERYDVEAKTSASLSKEQPLYPMIQALLSDRFKLKIHRETREMLVYSLVVDKDGPKLRANTIAPGPAWTMGRGLLKGTKISMAMFASDMLEKALARVVTDNTGIRGDFDVELTWAPDESQSSTPSGERDIANTPVIDSTGPSIFTALREQLGLKLAPRKSPVEVIVVESAEPPSGN